MKVLEQFKEKRQAATQNSVELTDLILSRLKDCMEDVRKYVFLDQKVVAIENFDTLHKTSDTPPRLHDAIPLNTSAKAVEAYYRLHENRGFVYYVGNWLTVDQDLIDQFSEVTDDKQWIHTDIKRAARSPFRSTIAQGFLTLSMIPRLTDGSNLSYEQFAKARFVVNVGLNKVRFPHPVKSGARVRASKKIVDVELVKRGVQITEEIVVDIENLSRPACIAETIVMLML